MALVTRHAALYTTRLIKPTSFQKKIPIISRQFKTQCSTPLLVSQIPIHKQYSLQSNSKSQQNNLLTFEKITQYRSYSTDHTSEPNQTMGFTYNENIMIIVRDLITLVILIDDVDILYSKIEKKIIFLMSKSKNPIDTTNAENTKKRVYEVIYIFKGVIADTFKDDDNPNFYQESKETIATYYKKVIEDPDNLQYISEKEQTLSICATALMKDPTTIQHIKCLKTKHFFQNNSI
jgi:hypothetical protein